MHATTAERPDHRLVVERAARLPLPAPGVPIITAAACVSQPLPVESLQHPLAVYDALLELPA